MNADTFGSVVNALIMALVGLWVWMLGVRMIGKPPGLRPEYDALHEQFGGKMRVAGPLAMVCAFVMLAIKLLSPR